MKTESRFFIPPLSFGKGVWLIPAAAMMNALFCWVSADILRAPVFLDSIFTAIMAALFGPVPGVLTGLLTNAGIELIYGFPGIHWPFGLCNIATGLIVGLMRNKVLSMFSLAATVTVLLVTLANSLLGTFIAILVFSGDTSVTLDYIVSSFVTFGQSLIAANFWARVLTNLIDKMIAVYPAFYLKSYLQQDNERTA